MMDTSAPMASSPDTPAIANWEAFAESFVSHPDADIFPMLDPRSQEFIDLVGSISESGLLNPVVLDRTHRVIDGRNRLKACLQTNQAPRFVYHDQLGFDGGTKYLVAALNLHRRHLTVDQRAMAAAKCYGRYKEAAVEKQKAGSKEGGRGKKKNLPTKRSEGFPEKPKDTRQMVAERAGVSERKAQQALTVVTAAPQLVAQVERGTRRPWLRADDRALRTLYPHLRSDDVAPILGRTISAVYARARLLGLAKSAAYNASPLSGRNVKGHAPHGTRTRFRKGHVPWNTGTHFHAGGRSVETQFKRGHRSARAAQLYQPIGALRINADGYVDLKVREAPGAKAWRGLHIELWEDARGPVPPGHCLAFRDRDKLNVCVENLELITRAENLRRNSFHRYPQPIPQLIQLRGALTRQINRRLKGDDHQEQADRPA
jgi:hypothetical protein